MGDGRGADVTFKFANTTDNAAIFFDTGTFGQSSYRRWGLYIGSGQIQWNAYTGTVQNVGNLLALEASAWYRAQLLLDNASGYEMRVWKVSEPNKSAYFTQVNPGWSSGPWTFKDQNNTGTQDVDTIETVRALAAG